MIKIQQLRKTMFETFGLAANASPETLSGCITARQPGKW